MRCRLQSSATKLNFLCWHGTTQRHQQPPSAAHPGDPANLSLPAEPCSSTDVPHSGMAYSMTRVAPGTRATSQISCSYLTRMTGDDVMCPGDKRQ